MKSQVSLLHYTSSSNSEVADIISCLLANSFDVFCHFFVDFKKKVVDIVYWLNTTEVENTELFEPSPQHTFLLKFSDFPLQDRKLVFCMCCCHPWISICHCIRRFFLTLFCFLGPIYCFPVYYLVLVKYSFQEISEKGRSQSKFLKTVWNCLYSTLMFGWSVS